MGPLARLDERACAGLVYKVVVEQTYRRQYGAQRVALKGKPTLVCLLKVDAETQRAVVDAHQLVVGEESVAHGVYQFLVVNLKKRPLAYLLYGAYLQWCDVYLLVLGYNGRR